MTIKLNLRKKDENLEKDILKNIKKGETTTFYIVDSNKYFERVEPILKKNNLGYEPDFVRSCCFVDVATKRTEEMDRFAIFKLDK